MADNIRREPVNPKTEGQGPTGSNRPMIVAVILCLLAVVAVYAWSRSNSGSRDITDVTRPSEGFEEIDTMEFESVTDSPDDQEIDRMEGDTAAASPTSALDAAPDSSRHLSSTEIAQLQQREQELQQAIQEKDALIADLNRQLTEAQTASDDKAVELKDSPKIPASAESKTHTVKKGETLTEISRLYYGSANRWKKIYDANSEKLSDKNRLRVGTVLVIPE